MSQSPRRLTLPSLAAAAAAAIAASACCVLPLALVLMGVSGAWISTLAALDVWRPAFTALALIALAAAFGGAYRRPARCDRPACAPARVRRDRLGVWIGAVAIGALLAFPYYASWLL